MTYLNCTLCETLVSTPACDIQKSVTLHSKTLMLNFLQRFTERELKFASYELCTKCYNLINELDSIKLRAKAIEELLNNYIDTRLKNCDTKNGTEDCKSNFVECGSEISVTLCKDDVNVADPLALESGGTNTQQGNIEITSKQDHTSLKPYPCLKCDKRWKTTSELKNHMRSHSDERPYICEICGQGYKKQKALTVHVGMHKGINPFTCLYCGKSFTQKGALVRHTPIHTGELKYQCDLCGKRFVHHTSFNIHKLSHSGQKSYKCSVCGLSLMSGSHLKRHMKVHTGEKKYTCFTCGKKFAEKYNLVVHEKLHLGISKKRETLE